ncbi:hypothetical protein [Burkholderia sp. 4M9327F10]|uniref:hypothetical protein n=1 Tax=Burkholderia sp. 4M9327F10 TaxID=2502223 RepID=UPI0010F9CCAD|nr:hypothetical protein [Burkholderia sp. 4M9327F10]
MPKIDIDAVTQSLAPDHDAPSDRRESALLVDLIEHIDAAIARGVPRAVVLSRLHDGGFTMTLPAFIKALQRIRKRLGRPAPRRSSRTLDQAIAQPATPIPQPRSASPVTQAATPNSASAVTNSASHGKTVKTREELQRENPTLSSVQISKLVAQQYADPVITSEDLEEMKRKYNPPLLKR